MTTLGLEASFQHVENGMIRPDMEACLRVADKFNEVIIFRSTGPWSRRWIEAGFPTKNFHVKGKSSNWGPQAGFVPYLGKYCKVGADLEKAADSTKANNKGIEHGYASTAHLELTHVQLLKQFRLPEEDPQRYAIHRMEPLTTSPRDFLLVGRRPGDNKEFAFFAMYNERNAKYLIHVYPDDAPVSNRDALLRLRPEPLLVMTSSEVGANNQPMTGDYDLMAVCPAWSDYMSRSTDVIEKSAVVFAGHEADAVGQRFAAGSAMDRVLDMRVNTGTIIRTRLNAEGKTVKMTYQRNEASLRTDEHGDMGNLTPRILRCINELNAEMNPTNPNTTSRRVHHNAESHRHAIFGALQGGEMREKNEGFPMTGFHPRALRTNGTWRFSDVATLDNMTEFTAYCDALHAAGYFVQRNAAWGMSVRDRVRNGPWR